ncbi:transposase [Chloroflexota bacterium]
MPGSPSTVYKMVKHQRRSIRLPEFDYSQPGVYFVTICVHGGECRLGEIQGGRMVLNQVGEIAHEAWVWLDEKFIALDVDVFCIMPNHAHTILTINEPSRGDLHGRGYLQSAPTTGEVKKKPLGRLVGAYKTHSTVLINKQLGTPGEKFWQRNYYERVIRNEREYNAVWEYIENNPANWREDENYYEGGLD